MNTNQAVIGTNHEQQCTSRSGFIFLIQNDSRIQSRLLKIAIDIAREKCDENLADELTRNE